MILMHPLVGMIYFVMLFILVLITEHPILLICFLIYIINMILIYNGRDSLIKSLKFSIIPIVMIIILNPIVSQEGRTVLYKGIKLPIMGKFIISFEGIMYGMNMSVKLLCIFLVFVLFSLITDRDEIFNFLSKYAYKLTLILSMSLNIIHRLILEVKRVKEVMIMRGVNFDNKNIIKRIKAYYPLFKVILISSLEGSITRAEALYSKGYGQGIRTSYYRNELKVVDLAVLINIIILFALSIFGIINKKLIFLFYPRITTIDYTSLIYILVLCLVMYSSALIVWGCKKWKFLTYRI